MRLFSCCRRVTAIVFLVAIGGLARAEDAAPANAAAPAEPDRALLEKQFAETMTGATLRGCFTMTSLSDAPCKDDKSAPAKNEQPSGEKPGDSSARIRERVGQVGQRGSAEGRQLHARPSAEARRRQLVDRSPHSIWRPRCNRAAHAQSSLGRRHARDHADRFLDPGPGRFHLARAVLSRAICRHMAPRRTWRRNVWASAPGQSPLVPC